MRSCLLELSSVHESHDVIQMTLSLKIQKLESLNGRQRQGKGWPMARAMAWSPGSLIDPDDLSLVTTEKISVQPDRHAIVDKSVCTKLSDIRQLIAIETLDVIFLHERIDVFLDVRDFRGKSGLYLADDFLNQMNMF